MRNQIRRREFITLLGGAAAAWPVAATAQQGGRVRHIGWLTAGLGDSNLGQVRLNAFKRGLADLGWIEGRSIAFE
jgi:putative tryptophan/tyrosine transport system substrate-binding protein